MTQLVRAGADRFRVVPWRGDREVALVSPVPSARAPGADAVRHCVQVLAHRGVREVVTGALSPPEVPAFVEAGFQVREHLHLLAHDLLLLPEVTHPVRLRRGRRSDRTAVLDVDAKAFTDEFWQLDTVALDDALDATASVRFRVSTGPEVTGYLVTGRAGDRGYLQRLAVDPARQREGIATALVADGLRWLRRHGAREALVNTQESNGAAIALYRRLGFDLRPVGLSVMTRRVTS